jgi:3-phenylpropionate/trans-cinnamate dioxygenase ferredoxin reductase subunit
VDRQTFVIVGAGLAGAEAAVQLRKDGFDGRLALIGEERAFPYERPPLSKGYLRGEVERSSFDVRGASFYVDHEIDFLSSTVARAVEPGRRTVVLDGGRGLRYERLLLATGSAPRRLEVPGADLPGIRYLRTLDDADAIRTAARTAGQAVVVGGGWIGAEVSASLRQMGLAVSMIITGSAPFQRVLGDEVAAVFGDLHREHGVRLVTGQRVTRFLGRRTVDGVETTDGSTIRGDLLVLGVGAQPRTELAAAAGLEVKDGVVVNERLETSATGIFAAGDIAAAWHPVLKARVRVEHWDNARRQGRAAARAMLGSPEPYARIPYFYSDQYDLAMEYTGHAPTWDRVVLRGQPKRREFVGFWLERGQVAAAMTVNAGPIDNAITSLVASRATVDERLLADQGVPVDDLVARAAQ